MQPAMVLRASLTTSLNLNLLIAAYMNMGEEWRMPTLAELEELLNNTTNEIIDNYEGTGVNVRLLTSNTNGNTLILPCGGYVDNVFQRAQDRGYIWASEIPGTKTNEAYYLGFTHTLSSYGTSDGGRYYGHNVRAVRRVTE